MGEKLTRRQFVKAGASLAALGLLSSCARRIPGLHVAPAARDVAPPRLLVDALGSKDLVVQADAARLLGDLGSPRAVGPLVRYVTECRHYAKTAGLDALARLGDPGVAPKIRPLLEEPNCPDDSWWYGAWSVRVATALTLLRLGDTAGLAMLIAPEPDHKDWALMTWFGPTVMRLPGGSTAVDGLKARLTVEKLLPGGKTDPGQIVVICDTLGLMGTDAARRKLTGLLGHMSRYVRARAALNLVASPGGGRGRTFFGSVSPQVAAMATDDPALFARIKASQAVVTAGGFTHAGRPFGEAIARAAGCAADPFDRAAALDSLGAIRRAEFVPVAIEQLRSPDAYVRLCAAAALDAIGDERGIGAVSRLRNDPDMRVRLQAVKCLAAHA